MLKNFLTFLISFSLKILSAQSVSQTNFSITDHFPSHQYEKMKMIQSHLSKVDIFDLTYNSFDETKIKGFLILPIEKSRKFPVIIYNRGGNGSFGMVSEMYIVRFLAKIASSGFIVIGSQLRGSEGSEGIDEFGGKEIDDVLALLNIVNKIEIADTSKIAQIGWSRGGITNFQLLKKTKKIRSTINIAGPSDILKTHRKEMFKVYRNRIKNYDLDSIYYAKKISPIFQIDSILNPKEKFLFIHGNKDERVEVFNSVELFEKTKKKGYTADLILFENGDHSLFDQFDKLIQEIIIWLTNIFYKT